MSEAYALHRYMLHRSGLRAGKMNCIFKLRNFDQCGLKVEPWRRVEVKKMFLPIKEPLAGRIQLLKDILDKETRSLT